MLASTKDKGDEDHRRCHHGPQLDVVALKSSVDLHKQNFDVNLMNQVTLSAVYIDGHDVF